ncbi:MAG: NADH-quinone oxidoreductase subunit J [Planctomycetota bacterium]
MDNLINPIILYTFCVLGAAGFSLALPRRGSALVPLGMILLGSAFSMVAVSFIWRAGRFADTQVNGGGGPGLFFYLFAAIALGAAIRVITHPRPVYSALYFIMTIIASCGMYVLLGAEFVAFALVIIYAGAILITYLFVIMLATQAPTGGQEGMLDETDAVAREPVVGSILGFVLMALISVMMLGGIDGPGGIGPGDPDFEPDAVLASLPGKVDKVLSRADLIADNERVLRDDAGRGVLDASARTITIENTELGTTRVIGPENWPADLGAGNLDRLGWNLLHDHPMTIEIAGVILLMAMLGATVLARKHVELEESLKAEQARRLGETTLKGRQAAGGAA